MHESGVKFTIGSAVRFGWDAFWRRPGLFVGATIIIYLAYAAALLVASGFDAALVSTGVYAAQAVPADQPDMTISIPFFGVSMPISSFSTPLGWLVYYALLALISMGMTAFYLAAHDDLGAAELSSLWHPHPFWKFVITYILASIVITFGFVLFIVPGIIFALMFLFTSYVVIDRKLDPIAAMSASRRIARGHKWRLLGFVIVLFFVNVLGALALGVGLLVSIPISMMAFAHAYRVLGEKVKPDAATPSAA